MFIINSPLEQFEIKPFITVPYDLLAITNYFVYSLIVLGILSVVGYILNSDCNILNLYSTVAKPKNRTIKSKKSNINAVLSAKVVNMGNNLVSNKWSLSVEVLYWTVYNMVVAQIGKDGYKYFPYGLSLFLLILISNLLGNIPYSFALTSHLILTIGLSFTIVLAITILGFKIHGLKFFALLCPVGTPLVLVPLLVLIETVSYIARAVSLGLRLGANIMAGHMLIVILAGFVFNILNYSILVGFVPFLLITAIGGLEIAISAIQSYVFVILVSSYLKDAISLH